MQVVDTIFCELTSQSSEMVDASRGDTLSRAVRCVLRADGLPWEVPEGATVSVAYNLPDGTPGRYAQLPDGSPAATVDGCMVTAVLSDRITAQAGLCEVRLVLTSQDGAQLATFPFRVRVVGGELLERAQDLPALGAEFEGKILFGGPGGRLEALEVGEGLEVKGGRLRSSGDGASGPHPTNPVVDIITIGGENGVKLESEGMPDTPLLTLYGAQGDEPVRVGNVAPAVTDGEAVPLGQVKELVRNQDSGQNANGLSTTAANLLITILRNGIYNTDQSANITALKNALASGGNSGGGEEPENPDIPDVPITPDDPEGDITQDGTTLVIVSALTVTQNGTTLTIE